jgi:hypothetical protein
MLRRKATRKNTELTVVRLKQYKGLGNLSDREAQEIVFTLQAFAAVLLEAVTHSFKT